MLKRLKPIHVLIISEVILIIAVCFLYNANQKKAKDIIRQTANFEQVTKEHTRELILKKSEYQSLNTTWKKKLDSVMVANAYKLRQVKSATIIEIKYRDTTSVKPISGAPIQKPDQSYIIPIAVKDQCWGMMGEISSNDKASTFRITERTANNSIQLIVNEKKRWIFWKKRIFEAFSDCGKVDITKIDFVK